MVGAQNEQVDEVANKHDFLLEPFEAARALLDRWRIALIPSALSISIVALPFIDLDHVPLRNPVDE